MRVKHWLIGCAICFAGIGSAVATTADSRDLDNSLRVIGDSGAHDGGNSSEPGVNNESGAARDGAPRNPGGSSRKGPSSSGSDHSGGDIAPPARAQQSHLGWQSLLPGSIQ